MKNGLDQCATEAKWGEILEWSTNYRGFSEDQAFEEVTYSGTLGPGSNKCRNLRLQLCFADMVH